MEEIALRDCRYLADDRHKPPKLKCFAAIHHSTRVPSLCSVIHRFFYWLVFLLVYSSVVFVGISASAAIITPLESKILVRSIVTTNDTLENTFELEPPNSAFGSLIVDETTEIVDASIANARGRFDYSGVTFGNLAAAMSFASSNPSSIGNLVSWEYEFMSDAAGTLSIYIDTDIVSSIGIGHLANGGRASIRNGSGTSSAPFVSGISNTSFYELPITAGLNELSIDVARQDIVGQSGNGAAFTRFLQWGIDGFAPGGMENPLLPSPIQDDPLGFVIGIPEPGTGTIFVDPEIAIGYDYQLDGNEVTSVLIPEALPGGDTEFEIVVDGQSAPLFAGTEFNFQNELGILADDSFQIRGIDPAEGLDPDDAAAFVTGLTFADPNSSSTLTMTPVTVPEPSSLALAAIGIVGLLSILARKNALPYNSRESKKPTHFAK